MLCISSCNAMPPKLFLKDGVSVGTLQGKVKGFGAPSWPRYCGALKN